MPKHNGVSIIICCYNSAKRLPETLKHIADQDIKNNMDWELIIVDNNSSDKTVTVANYELDKYETLKARTKIISENQPGLFYARKAGTFQSKFEIVLFCDDDNWLDVKYVANMYSLFEKFPKLGIIGAGIAYGEYEVNPPKWFLQYKHLCAIFEKRRNDEIGFTIEADVITCGAGMGLRKELASAYFNENAKVQLTDRTENLLLSGGDSDMNYYVLKRGFGIGKFVSLHFKHYMPKERISKRYLQKLAYGLSYSSVLLAKKNKLISNKWSLHGYIFALLKILLSKGLFHTSILQNQYQGQKDAYNKL